MHTSNLQMVATEMLKVYRNISQPIFSEIFYRSYISYNLTFNSGFAVLNVRSFFLTSFFTYLGPKICDIVALELKELTSVDAFKKFIKIGAKKISMYAI